MAIWFTDVDINQININNKDTIHKSLGIKITELTDDSITGTMPVDHRTRQPHGILHGGASVVLAETLGSLGAYLTLDTDRFYSVGLEINANHVRPVSSGIVTGTATPAYIGRTVQIWETKIYTQEEKLNCISRITVAVRPVE
jgi:1,4-dihydroxy-2-naphthoyl-CoA hydrolase